MLKRSNVKKKKERERSNVISYLQRKFFSFIRTGILW